MKIQALLLLLLMQFCLYAKGQSVHFPKGFGNRLDIGDLDVAGTALTVEAIITPQPSTGQAMDIVCKHYVTPDVNYFLRSTTFAVRAGNKTIGVTNPVTLCANTTYHVAGTYDGQSLKYYVNGIMVASVPCSGQLNLNDNIASIGNMWNKEGNYNEQYSGYIDEVRIWKIARKPTEIAANMYNLSNPFAQQGLLAYYKFDGNFKNMQGNAAWDGKPNKTAVRLTIDPYFKGAVSNTFCGGEDIFKKSQKNASETAQSTAAVGLDPAVAALRGTIIAPEAQYPIKPQRNVTALPSSCSTINWAVWNSFSGKTATGNLRDQSGTVTATIKSGFDFDSAAIIWHYGEFGQYPSQIPNATVPNTTWTPAPGKSGLTSICFSKPVKNPVLLLASLGSKEGEIATVNFSIPFVVLYESGRIEFNKASISGIEGYTIIMFPGNVSCLTISSSTFESYTNFTIGLPACAEPPTAPVIPKPPAKPAPPKAAPAPVVAAPAPQKTELPPQPVKAVTAVLPVPQPVKKAVADSPVAVKPTAAVSKAGVASKGRLQLEIWDYDCMDFDSVSIKFNGKQVGPTAIQLQLYKKYGQFTFDLDYVAGDNILEIHAINEGVNPFNTIGILLVNDDSRKKYFYKLKPKEDVAMHFLKN